MPNFNLVSLKDFIPRSFEIFSRKNGKGYDWASFGKDCLAGVTVGVVALPLAMAFSISAGGTPAQGLYTAITAGFLVSFLGGSKFQIGGPTGAFVVIIFGIIAKHGMAGLATAGILAGVILIIMGLTGLGRFIKFIPYPVTTGFTTGIGLLIFSQQVKDFFGLSPAASSPEFIHMWGGYIKSINTISPVTLGLGLGTMTVILLIKKFYPRIPAAVVGIIAAAVACKVLSLPAETIGMRFGAIPQSLPRPELPAFSFALIREVLPDSLAIALLAAIESLLSAVVADGMSGDRHNGNMELVAQGFGNIASILFGGIPATGAIARTATNIKAGAASPVAGMIHALTLLLFILFLAPLASAVPLASLSAVLIIVSWDMSNIPRFVRILYKAPKSDALVLLTTFALTVLVDLTFAVEAGVVLAAFLFMRRMMEVTDIRPDGHRIGDEIVYGKPDEAAAKPKAPKNIEIYEITGPFFFGVADSLQRILMGIEKKPKTFVLRMRDVPAVDSTGIAALESFLAQCRHRKINLILCEIREQPRKALEKSGFIEELGPANLCGTLEEALA
ncbi:SulP family inorganic anion transporter [Leadbettera azotonutricia]|uniref:Sulfate permease n=1 Tax=Leadbettera azotonutricia (strain ATCC BAA-888 / DSM 13862 / ZAS-9) TaxID=545695 RepID=F5YCH6_LEAAZ|nr:SulP family inorganic anion transporter [Leadbettera azotonutricia]AEF80580.1 sulfate permease [Leadbettera azotonutricia ZAS-9]